MKCVGRKIKSKICWINKTVHSYSYNIVIVENGNVPNISTKSNNRNGKQQCKWNGVKQRKYVKWKHFFVFFFCSYVVNVAQSCKRKSIR